ncbi:MAG: L,D-transpeptidase family protein [Nitrospirae bacterium]|nr:L,D-transpeptidase family protein [Nitrospirota bacterium]
MKILFLLIVLVLAPSVAAAGIIINTDTEYRVEAGDTLERIGGRFGVDWRVIARENSLADKSLIRTGSTLRIRGRRIVPATLENGIIINIPDRTLYYFRNGELADCFPVGLGSPSLKFGKAWKTPLGKFTIKAKEKDPAWHVPPTIREEMEKEGKEVKTVVPPGPDNPLGRHALHTSIQGILIHETIWPGSVYQFRSHGCIRVHPENMKKFFGKVERNDPGELIYMPVKAALTSEGRVLLEVHRDAYGMVEDLGAEAARALEKLGLKGRADPGKVDKVIREKTGMAEDVTL